MVVGFCYNFIRWETVPIGHSLIIECALNALKNKEINFINVDDVIKNQLEDYLGYKFNKNMWFKYQEEDSIPTDIKLDLPKLDIVVGFEIAPSICKLLSYNNIKYLNFFNHPVRFLPDLLWNVVTNDELCYHNLIIHDCENYMLSDMDNVILNLKSNLSNNINTLNRVIKPNTAVIFAQTPFDAAVLKNKKFINLYDYRENIKKIVNDKNDIIIIPHPLLSDNTKLIELVKYLGKGKIATFNSYALLSCKNVTDIITISSSLGIESKYFNKNIHLLMGHALDEGTALRCSNTYMTSIGQNVLRKEFWSNLFNNDYSLNKTDNPYKITDLFRSKFGGWALDNKCELGKIFVLKNDTEVKSFLNKGIQCDIIDELYNIDFCKEIDKYKFFSSGLSGIECDGRWTDDEVVEVIVVREKSFNNIYVEFEPFINDVMPKSIVKIYVNEVLKSYNFFTKNDVYIINMPILDDEPFINIKFTFPNHKKSMRLLNNDIRLLGVRLKRIIQK